MLLGASPISFTNERVHEYTLENISLEQIQRPAKISRIIMIKERDPYLITRFRKEVIDDAAPTLFSTVDEEDMKVQSDYDGKLKVRILIITFERIICSDGAV